MRSLLITILGVATFLSGSSAYALKSGFNVRRKVGKKYVKTKMVTGRHYRYVKSSGNWRKIINTRTKKSFYVWHKAVTPADIRQASSSGLKKASINVNNYSLRKNYNFRKSPNGKLVKKGRGKVTTSNDSFSLTGKFKYSAKGDKWYQAVSSSGKKGFIHEDALFKTKKVALPPLPVPKTKTYEKPAILETPAQVVKANKKAKKVDPKTMGLFSGYNIRSDRTTNSPSLGFTDTNDFKLNGHSEIGKDGKETWAQVEDGQGRSGWVHFDGVTRRSEDTPLPTYSQNKESTYREGTSETPSYHNIEVIDRLLKAPPRKGKITANALKPNRYDRGLERCVNDKKRLARLQRKARKFPTSSYLAAISQGVSPQALSEAVKVYNQNQNIIKNKKYLTVIDFGLPSTRKRFHVINVKTGEVFSTYTSHGKGSDRDHNKCVDGRKAFSNISGSNKSSEGFMITGGFYGGKHGRSMIFHGLEKGKNDKACARSIVAHGAKYVPGGRSHGCPALLHNKKSKVYKMIGHGSLTYFYPGEPGKKCINHVAEKKKRKRKRRRRRRRRRRRG